VASGTLVGPGVNKRYFMSIVNLDGPSNKSKTILPRRHGGHGESELLSVPSVFPWCTSAGDHLFTTLFSNSTRPVPLLFDVLQHRPPPRREIGKWRSFHADQFVVPKILQHLKERLVIRLPRFPRRDAPLFIRQVHMLNFR